MSSTKLSWDDFIGNTHAIAKLQLLIDEAVDDEDVRIPDLALLGPSGHGKTTLARIIADTLSRKLLIINSTVIKDPFQFRGLIIDLFTNNPHGSIVLLDECHALQRSIQDNLLTATEHPRHLQTTHKGETFNDSLPKNCSFIFATTHSGKIKEALLTRLEQIELMTYTSAEQATMALRYLQKEHGVNKADLTVDVLMEIATRARNGRQVVKFCDTMMRFKRKHKLGKLTRESVENTFKVLDVDKYGLTKIDRLMLTHLLKMNGTVGLDTLDAVMPCTKARIKDQIEPYLLSKGFIVRTSAGRMITTKGRQALK